MSRIINFVWSSSAVVPPDFNPDDPVQYAKALYEAWGHVQCSDGDMTDDFNEPADVMDMPEFDLTDGGPYATDEDQETARDLGISVYKLRCQRASEDRS